MLETFRPGSSLPWDLAWQSTFFLLLGGLASLAASRRPARAHRALFLAMIAGLATPLLCQGVRGLGLGLIAPRAVVVTEPTSIEMVASPVAVDFAAPSERPRPVAMPIAAATPDAKAPEPATARSFDIISLAIAAWVALAVVAAARLMISLASGLLVVARARRIDDPAILGAADAARARLGLAVRPDVYASDRVRCPVIWCWGRRPRLIVPESAAEGRVIVDWVAVLSHELAHWGRRDHVAGMVGEVAACILPWHPLAWWAKGRMGQLAELACDDWVLASGQSAEDYAETLLGLVPQGRSTLALAAVMTRGGLVGRIRRILDDVRREPNPGRRWTAIAAVATAMAASVTALAQSRPAAAPKADETKAAKPDETKAAAPIERVVSGRVLGPDGKPASGASVVWTYQGPASKQSFVAMPKQMQNRGTWKVGELGRASADADGRFRIAAGYDPKEIPSTILVARAPGTALAGRGFWEQEPPAEVTLKLTPSVKIEGRLLNPSGGPASGVKVELVNFHAAGANPLNVEGITLNEGFADADRPDYWPRPMTTGADGRFTIDSIVPRGVFAQLKFRHPDYADDEVTVSTGLAITDALRAFDVRPVRPQFTHALEPARPVEGIVTDKATGKPIADVTIELIPMRTHGGMSFFTRTDAKGHYRVAGHQAGLYFVHAWPDAGSGYVDASRDHNGWPEGAKALTMNFALSRGKIFRGTVVDAETRAPIAGASVVYQPRRGNPHVGQSGDQREDFRNPVLTDASGRFAISGLPGEGYLLVEAAAGDYIRGRISGKEAGFMGQTLYPHGSARVDAKPDAEPAATEIALRKGKALEARALDPDGKPLAMVFAWCPELTYRQLQNWTSPQLFAGGVFKLPGAEPDRTYRVYFLEKGRKLGAVANLTLDPARPGPIDVKLQPMGTAKGVAVNKDGTPVKGAQIYPVIVLAEGDAPMKGNDFYDREKAEFYSNMTQEMVVSPTSPAEFAFSNLIPGVRYYITIARGPNGRTDREVRPKAGEVVDLGKVVMEDNPQ